MAEDDDLVGEMNIGVVQRFLVKRTTIHNEDVMETRDRAPNMRVDVVATFLVRLSGNDDDLLKLELVQVPRSKRHYETFDRRVDAAHNNMVLYLRVLQGGEGLTDDRSSVLRTVHVIIIHHLFVFPFLLVDLVTVSDRPHGVHASSLLLIDLRVLLIIFTLPILVFVLIVVSLFQTFGEVTVGLLLIHIKRLNLLSLVGARANNVYINLIVDDVIHHKVAWIQPNNCLPVRLDLDCEHNAV